jgi:hypothetical protein
MTCCRGFEITGPTGINPWGPVMSPRGELWTGLQRRASFQPNAIT